MKVAISGSRGFTDWDLIERVVDRLIEGDHEILVGDAPRGVDRMVTEYILHREDDVREWRVFRARWREEGRRAGMTRNAWMVGEADMLIAIFAPGPLTPGTLHAVECARRASIPRHIYHEGHWETERGRPRRTAPVRSDDQTDL